MKQLMIMLTLVVTCSLFTACCDDDWGTTIRQWSIFITMVWVM